ncbi:hypothetical protein C8R41DRAFT_863763 [Lentinula lateritia]|uniref:Uncharacterized protein n=1 Tax=Lentinula lateritia TaxID=40482 RepID=A0ABQ8VX37_9AGAR|nr:hypothetical protein C8R41DRAFT_863763 [Lentinula lateritia]
MTGIEILIITAVSTKLVAVIESNCTSVLIKEARKILNDERIMNLLSLLYELDPKLAVENNKRYTSAASLALEYQNSMAVGQYFGCQDQTSTGEQAAQMRANADYSLSSNVKYVQSLPKTPEYILQTPGRAAFAYPQVGSKPILPDGLKFGTLAYYYQGQPEEDDGLVLIIEIRDLPKYPQCSSAEGFHHSLHRQRSTDSEELIEDVIYSGLQDITETVHCIGTFRTANRSNSNVASIVTTYLSFDGADTEGGSISDKSLLNNF